LFSHGFTPDDLIDLKKSSRKDESRETWIPRIVNGKIQLNEHGVFMGETLAEVTHRPRLLVIFDGYDEIGGTMNIHEAYKTAEWADLKVILTSRTEYLEGKQWGPLFKPKGVNQTNYQEIFIRPFDDNQIKNFITQTLARWEKTANAKALSGLKKEDYLDLVLNNQELRVLIEHPFMLEIVMNILPKLKESKEKEAALKGQHFKGLGKVNQLQLYISAQNPLFEGKALLDFG